MYNIFRSSLFVVALALFSGNVFAATHLVPDDFPTSAGLINAFGAASYGDTIEITDSGTYMGLYVSKGGITIKASAGQMPVIRMNASGAFSHVFWMDERSTDTQIGSNDGGTINIELDQLPGQVIRGALGIFPNKRDPDTFTPLLMDPTTITFENLLITGDTGGHHSIQIGQGVGAGCGPNTEIIIRNVTVEDHVQAANVLSIQQLTGATLTVEDCNFDDPTGVAVSSYFNGTWGTLNIRDSIIVSTNTCVRINNAAPVGDEFRGQIIGTWTVNLDRNCFESIIPGAHTVNLSNPSATYYITKSAIQHTTTTAVYLGTANENSTFAMNHCDLFGGESGTGVLRLDTPTTNNVVTVENTNFNGVDSSAVGLRVLDGDNTVSSNNNNYNVATATEGVSTGAGDVSPGLQPQYADPANCDFRYADQGPIQLATGGSDGFPIGSDWNFVTQVPVELSVFSLQ